MTCRREVVRVLEAHETIEGAGMIGAGDVQWMTGGSGFVHRQMPMSVD